MKHSKKASGRLKAKFALDQQNSALSIFIIDFVNAVVRGLKLQFEKTKAELIVKREAERKRRKDPKEKEFEVHP